MAFILEDGTGLTNSTSYSSITFADDYHSRSLYKAEWDDATSPQKEIALMMATRVIDTDFRFRGFRKTKAQALQWPRIRVPDQGVYNGYGPGWGIGLIGTYYDEAVIPQRLKMATAQGALDLLRGDRTLESSTKGIQSVSVGQGAVALTFENKASDRPMPLTEEVIRLLSPIGSVRYGGGTVRARKG